MNCKNCETSLNEHIRFCPLCGAKVVRNRLTIKNIWFDINEQFFNIDNKLFKTIFHLFTKPEAVINGFIDGTRKKYIHVIQYFAISLTLVGLQVFVMNTFFKESMIIDGGFFEALDKTAKAQKDNPFNNINYEDFNNYISLYYTLSIPFSAISTWVAYRVVGVNRFNFTEHIVINLYYYAQAIIITSLFTMVLLCFGLNYMIISTITTVFILIYFFHVLKRVFQTSFLETLAYFILTFISIFVVFVVIMIFIFILGFFIGYLLKKTGVI